MKIQVKNLGVLKQAEFELGDLTIICGGNNTGKTYATYALYGFLMYWRKQFYIDIPQEIIKKLLTNGSVILDLHDYIQSASEIIKKGCKEYSEQLPKVFSSSKKYFSTAEFHVEIDWKDKYLRDDFQQTIGSTKSILFSIQKHHNDTKLSVSLLMDNKKIETPTFIISQYIGDAIKEILFERVFYNPFIVSAERTGSAVFRKELKSVRNLWADDEITENEDNPFALNYGLYPGDSLPVQQNVEFMMKLEDVTKDESYILEEHSGLLNEFADILGGKYVSTQNDELFFIPSSNKQIQLTIHDSSSSVRSLLLLNFYLYHVAQIGDLLIVDEPELNLHPENQRRLARLFAHLVNLGIKVFITTHSDYFIKELNTLIMLNHDKPHLKKIMKEEGYKQEELISSGQVRVYIAEENLCSIEGNKKRTRCNTLVPANIDPELGIEARSFDITIDDMNRIQEEIIWGGE